MPWRRSKSSAEEVWQPPPKPWRVLLAADDPDRAELLGRLLHRAGHDVGITDGARSAVVALMKEPAHCVVLALTRAGAGGNLAGLDLIRHSNDARVSRSRVVLCADRSGKEMFSWESGVDGYVQTPFHERQLMAEIESAVSVPDDDLRTYRRDRRDAAQRAGRRSPAAGITPERKL